MENFVHLHVHTQYSLLQGAILVDQLLDQVEAFGMPAVAITDTHNLFGCFDFYLQAKKKKIKPLIGSELFFAPDGRHCLKPNSLIHHLVVLCKNQQGYQNLCKLLTESFEQSAAFHASVSALKSPPVMGKTFIDQNMLSKYSEGLIVLSGCIKGPLCYDLLTDQEPKAVKTAQWFLDKFGDDFYLELQDSDIPEQNRVNDKLLQMGKSLGIACVATTDCHYLHADDCKAHEVLQCIDKGKQLNLDQSQLLAQGNYFFKTAAQMRERFAFAPEACDNTLKVAEKIDLEFAFTDAQGRKIYHLPRFVPEGLTDEQKLAFDEANHFRLQAQAGLERRFKHPSFAQKDPKVYEERLAFELDMIIQTGFAGYFLIVADFINWAKEQQIPVGPGRGSGAGSLVAYSLRITDIDPIEFNLLFERFINPERISMPDFDIDFCQDQRERVIQYVAGRYGASRVSQIITFGKLLSRVVLKDVGRVLGMSFQQTDQLTKLFPDGLDMTLEKVCQLEPKFIAKIQSDSRLEELLMVAKKLEGLYRNAGVHAAGVIITEKPIVTYCPLYAGKDGHFVTQLDKDFCEAIGLVKFDFLGLKTLTVIDNTVKLIRLTEDKEFCIENIDHHDSRVFALISLGDTNGVFQVESSGMKDLCQRIVPNSLEDLTAINALYRPGPLGSGMVDDFIDRKHKRKQSTYEVAALEPILKDTYGVILYQEQVMQIARELAGYSLGQADLLRRAMGKKKADEMAKHKEIFVQGALKKGLQESKAAGIFDLMAKFAEYGFNKSHSAAYGLLTYQTAFLKAHYPTEFLAALMTTEMLDIEKLSKYIADAKNHGIEVLTPDINTSLRKFSVETHDGKKKIRFALEAIKGLGQAAADAILEGRKDKKFTSVVELATRMAGRKMNKKVLEALCSSGALDSIAEANRATIFSSTEAILKYGVEEQERKQSGQMDMFALLKISDKILSNPIGTIIKEQPEWSVFQKLQKEREVVGFYVSGHPMQGWQQICEQWFGMNTQILKTVKEKKTVYCAAMIAMIREVSTKKGRKMAFLELEDLHGKAEMVVFPQVYERDAALLNSIHAQNQIALFAADVEIAEDSIKLLANQVKVLEKAPRNKKIKISLNLAEIRADQLRELKQQVLAHRGNSSLILEFRGEGQQCIMPLQKHFSVEITPSLFVQVEKIFKKPVVFLAS